MSFGDKFSCSWDWGCSVWCEHLLHSVFLLCRVALLEEGWSPDLPGWSLLLDSRPCLRIPHTGRFSFEERSQSSRPGFSICQPRSLRARYVWSWLLAGTGQQSNPNQSQDTCRPAVGTALQGDLFTRPKLTQPLKVSRRGGVQPQAPSPKQLSISSRMVAIHTLGRCLR